MTTGLLGHERWLAALVRQRQAERRTASVLRTESRYGPAGIDLLAAALTDVLLGQVGVLLGLGLLALKGGSLAPMLGWVSLGLGVIIVAASSVRFGQGVAAGREHRGKSRSS
jgi:hypothetical protein